MPYSESKTRSDAWAWRLDACANDDEAIDARIQRLAIEAIREELDEVQGRIANRQARADAYDQHDPYTATNAASDRTAMAHADLERAHQRYAEWLGLYQAIEDGTAPLHLVNWFAGCRIDRLNNAAEREKRENEDS